MLQDQIFNPGSSFHDDRKYKTCYFGMCNQDRLWEKSDFKKDYRILMSKGLKVVAVRHPMPGNLSAQKVQRFADVNLEK